MSVKDTARFIGMLLLKAQLGPSVRPFHLVELMSDDGYGRLLQAEPQTQKLVAPPWVERFLFGMLNGRGQDNLCVTKRFQVIGKHGWKFLACHRHRVFLPIDLIASASIRRSVLETRRSY